MNRNARILVAGGETLAGKALLRVLAARGFDHVLPTPENPVDLRQPSDARAYFEREKPEYVFLVGGLSGGIGANLRRPADLMLDNLRIQLEVLENAHRIGVRKLLFLASSCCYPRDCPQPITPGFLLTGPLEPSNESYAVAKIAGIKLCQALRAQAGCSYIVAIPATPYGPDAAFDPEQGHVIEALIRRMHEAKQAGARAVTVWGSGRPQRDFLFADDLADACLFVMDRYDDASPIHLGPGEGISIGELANQIREVVGFTGAIEFDTSRPDGMPLKCLDVGPLRELGWRPRWTLRDGLAATYEGYVRKTDRHAT